jgi:hypothetical protein
MWFHLNIHNRFYWVNHLLALLMLVMVSPASAAYKCWTNHEGVRECGDVVPPEYSQDESKTYSDKGVVIGIKNRALTREELTEKRRRTEEALKKEIERKNIERKQAADDRVLLSTYLNTQEITNALDRKLAVINGYIELNRITRSKLEDKRKEEEHRAANMERQGRVVSQAILDEIARIGVELESKSAFIRGKEREKEELRKKYQVDFKRFEALKRRSRSYR